MKKRQPAFDTFDAVMRLGSDGAGGDFAYTLVKQSYTFHDGNVERCAPLALENVPEPGKTTLPPFTDFYSEKQATDVIVLGDAFAPYGVSTEHFSARLSVGDCTKDAAVFGPRTIRVIKGRPCISAPEPVLSVSLDRTEAYGGMDALTPVYADPGSEAEAALSFDHPGIYPRNSGGNGYLVVLDSDRELSMPSLEDPYDLLDEDRIRTPQAYLWYQQPLPCFFGRTAVYDFPRIAHLGSDAWFLGPEDERLKEVAKGWLPPSYRSAFENAHQSAGVMRFRQEASPDLIFPTIAPGTPFTFYNMHPERPVIGFDFLFALPRIEFEVAGETVPAETRIHNIVCSPNEEQFTVVFGASTRLTRKFLPGIHRNIPLAARIDGEALVRIETPKTNRELLAEAAMQAAASKGVTP